MIELRYRSPLRELAGKPSDMIDAGSVGEALRYIRRSYGKQAYRQAAQMLITVDGTSILLMQNRRTQLQEGAVVAFLPLCGGG